MTRHLAIVFLALCLSQAALGAPDKLTDAVQEGRAVQLQKQFRCLVCQGESLDESNAPLAADLRHLIRERIAAGDSDAAVKRYLVARYGDFILMRPPVRGDTYVLWFAPLGLILAGSAVLALIGLRAHERLKTAGLAGADHEPANSREKT